MLQFQLESLYLNAKNDHVTTFSSSVVGSILIRTKLQSHGFYDDNICWEVSFTFELLHEIPKCCAGDLYKLCKTL